MKIQEEEGKNTRIGPALIIIAGCFWGSMGIFVRSLGEYGFEPTGTGLVAHKMSR